MLLCIGEGVFPRSLRSPSSVWEPSAVGQSGKTKRPALRVVFLSLFVSSVLPGAPHLSRGRPTKSCSSGHLFYLCEEY